MRLAFGLILSVMVVAASGLAAEAPPPAKQPSPDSTEATKREGPWWNGTPAQQEAALRAAIREERQLLGHTAPVTSLAYSPDGKRAISSSEDRTVRLWDVEGATEIRQFDEPSEATVRCLAFAPDGSKVFAGDDGKALSIWDTETGKRLHRLEGHAAAIRKLVVSPDGKAVVTTGTDGEVRRWDPETGTGTVMLKPGRKAVPLVHPFFTRSELVTPIESHKWATWDTTKWKQQKHPLRSRWAGKNAMYVAAAEKPFLATIEGKDVRLFWTPEHAPPQQPEMRWWSEAKKVTTGMRRVYDAAYMEGDGFLRVYGGGGSVETWRIVAVPRRSPPQPEPAGRFDAPVDGVRCAALAPDGHEGLSGYDDGHIGVWKLPFARPQPSDIFAGVAKYIQIKFTDADFDALETEFGAYRSRRVFVPTSDDALATAYETLFAPAAAQRTDLAWKSHFNMIDEWIKAKPTSVTPRIVQAGSLVKHAWEARGSGFAHTVTEKGFALFHERLQAARDALEKAIKLDPNDPEIYELVVHIGQGGLYSRKEVDQAVEKCRALAPDYAPLYTTMAVYLLPRWHGEPGELEKWVDSVTEAGTPLGDSLYARVAATVLRFERDGFGSRAESEYARIKNGFDVLTERFPESTWVASQRAYFASMHHDLATAQEAFRQMDQLQALHPTSIWGTDEIYDRARRWADPNAPRGQERLLIWGATWSINKVHVTPDGKQIISVGRERKAPIGIWSRESGKLIDWMPAGGLQIHSATVSPDGLLAYVGGLHHPSGQVLLLRANIRRLEIDGVIPCQTNARMKQVAVSDDGTLMAAAFGDTKVRLWNLEDGSEQEGIVHEAPVTRVLFSSDSKRLATQSGGHAHVWDVESGKLLDTFESADSDAAIALSPDGQLLAVYEDGGKAAIWNLTTKQKTTADETFPIMLAAAFSHDGLMLAVGTYDGRDRAIKVVDVASGTVLKTFLGHFDHVQSLAFAPDDTELISGSDDCTVRVWDLSGLKKKAPAPPGEDQ